MTDNEIIKALECCTSSTTSEACNGCPLYDTTICTEMENGLQIYALDLINRQKDEIERLHSEVKEKTETIVFLRDQAIGWCNDFCNLKEKLKTAKTEAIKEFAESLKKSAFECDVTFEFWGEHFTEAVTVVAIDNLVKEMTEGKQDAVQDTRAGAD